MSELNKSYENFIHKPLPYLFALVSFLFYSFLNFFVMYFLYSTAFIALDKFALTSYVYGVIALLSFIFLYFETGFYGAMLKGFEQADRSRTRFDTVAYLDYAFRNAPKFFVATLILLIINAIIIAPLGYVMYMFSSSTIVLVGAGLALAFILFLVNYLFYYSTIALTLFDKLNALRAIKASIIVALKNIKLIVPYILFIILLLTLPIVLINLLTLFVLLPISYVYSIRKLKNSEHLIAKYI